MQMPKALQHCNLTLQKFSISKNFIINFPFCPSKSLAASKVISEFHWKNAETIK
jgi:hypothetical protein